MYTRLASLGAIATLFHHFSADAMPREVNVAPLSVDAKTSFMPAVSAVPIQISPVGPIVSASIHTFAVELAVVNVQPPSRLIRNPSNVVA